MKRIIAAIALLFAVPVIGAVTLPYTFTTSLPISQVNANFSALRDEINNHEALANGHSTGLDEILPYGNSVGVNWINFNNQVLQNARLEVLSADPSCGPSLVGKILWNSTLSNIRICNGSGFINVITSATFTGAFADEVPSGAINGANTVFTISATPVPGSFVLYLDELRLRSGVHYTLSGTTITMTTAPNFGQTLDCNYAY